MQGYLSYQDCQWLEAEEAFVEAKTADPNDPAAYHWHALMLSSVGRTAAALEFIQQAYALDQNNAAIAHVLGMQLDARGEITEAQNFYRKAAELGFFGGSLWYTGLSEARLGNWSEAETIWRMQPYPLAQVADPVTLNLGLLAAIQDPAARGDFYRQVMTAWRGSKLTFRGAMQLLVASGAESVAALFEDGQCREDIFYLWDQERSDHLAEPALYEALSDRGLVDYWQAHGWPDQCAALDAAQAECPDL